MKKVTILNTSILTTYGNFQYAPITLEEAKTLVTSENGFTSAVGHESTANVLTSLLGVNVEVNRIEYAQQVNDLALIFKLNSRPEEGKILTVEEIEEIGYILGTITKTSDLGLDYHKPSDEAEAAKHNDIQPDEPEETSTNEVVEAQVKTMQIEHD